MEASSPARLYCLLTGAALVIAGIIGFFWESSFSTGESLRSDKLLDILAVNGWHNLVHLSIGLVLLAGAGSRARLAALGVGATYLVITVLGFMATGDGGINGIAEHGSLLDLIPINDEDNALHVILALTGLVAGYTSGRRGARARA